MSIFNVFTMMGGLAMFLFGMDVMGKALEKQAGNQLQSILSKLTDNPLKGFCLGVVVTAIIQSSSATTVMVVGFVNSGLMQLHQAIGIIMGSNVGTTVTSWILSLSGLEGDNFLVRLCKPSSFAPVLAFIGIVLYMFVKDEKKKGIGTILLGFTVLMTGMETMSDAVKPLADVPAFTALFTRFENPLLGVLVGALLTAVIQSSSASVGILQALCATGSITVGAAIPIIMGQNIGTCATALISSVGANKNAKRAAVVHLYFNIIGVSLFFVLFYGMNAFLHFQFVKDTANAMSIAVVHSVFNIVATAVLLPFNRVLEKLAMMTIRADATPDRVQLLDERLLATPALAVNRAHVLSADMANYARSALLQSMSLTHKFDPRLAAEVEEEEEQVDRYEDMLGSYLVKLSSRNMTLEDSHETNELLHIIGDFERIGDHAVSVLHSAQEIADKGYAFSPQAMDELEVLEAAVQDIVSKTINCFEQKDLYTASKIEPLEQVVDELVAELKRRHIARLQAGDCTIEMGFILSDLLNNYERIADHCSNVAVAMIEVDQDSFDTHEYLNEIKTGGNAKFSERFERYRSRYVMAPIESDTKETEQADAETDAEQEETK